MATAHITEYQELAADGQGNIIQAGKEPAITTQAVTFTTATNSSALDGKTKLIRVIADADAHITFDGTTATANSMRLEANTAEYFGVEPGATLSIYDGTS